MAIDPNIQKVLDLLSSKILDAISELHERIDAIENTVPVFTTKEDLENAID